MCNVTVINKLAKKNIQVYCIFMRILPITFGIKNQYSTVNTKSFSTPISRNSAPLNYSDIYKTNNNSNIVFSGKYPNQLITNKNELKKLAKNGHLGCIWCGGSMFMQNELDMFQHISKRLASNGELFSRVILHFKDYLPPERIKLIKLIANYSKAYPNKDLKFILNKMTPAAEKRLTNKQFFILHKIKNLKQTLPTELHKDLDTLIKHSTARIKEIPYVSEYSAKEFYYQLNNLAKTLPLKVKEEILTTGQVLTHPIFKEPEPYLPEKWLKKIYQQTKINPKAKGNYISPNDLEAKKKLELILLNKISLLAKNNNNSSIIKLCDLTKNKILGIPVQVQFSNKAFVYKLHEILDNVKDERILNQFTELTQTLPTSLDNMDAFIVKYKNESTDTIITKLLADSLVTLEHITPILRNTSDKDIKQLNKNLAQNNKIKRGTDSIDNWALAHGWCNFLHGSKNIKNENFPFSKEAGIKYFKTLVKDVNQGLLSARSVINMAKNYFEQTGIKIKLTGMKYTKE